MATMNWRPARDRTALPAFLRGSYPGGDLLLDAGVCDTPYQLVVVTSDGHDTPTFEVAAAACETAVIEPGTWLMWGPVFAVDLLRFGAVVDQQSVSAPLPVTTLAGRDMLAVMVAGVVEAVGPDSDEIVAAVEDLDAIVDLDTLAARGDASLLAATFAGVARIGMTDPHEGSPAQRCLSLACDLLVPAAA